MIMHVFVIISSLVYVSRIGQEEFTHVLQCLLIFFSISVNRIGQEEFTHVLQCLLIFFSISVNRIGQEEFTHVLQCQEVGQAMLLRRRGPLLCTMANKVRTMF